MRHTQSMSPKAWPAACFLGARLPLPRGSGDPCPKPDPAMRPPQPGGQGKGLVPGTHVSASTSGTGIGPANGPRCESHRRPRAAASAALEPLLGAAVAAVGAQSSRRVLAASARPQLSLPAAPGATWHSPCLSTSPLGGHARAHALPLSPRHATSAGAGAGNSWLRCRRGRCLRRGHAPALVAKPAHLDGH